MIWNLPPNFWHAHQEHKTLGVVGAAPVWIRTGSSTVSVYVAEKFRNHLQKLSQPGYQLNLRDFYSGNFSIRREVLIAVGLFDEEFKLYGNEDLELALRLKKARVSIIFCMEALAHQYYEKDFSALARDSIEKGKTAVLFVRKHPEALSDLKIGTYNEASPRWAFLRALLLKASRVWSGTPKIVVHVVTLLERIRPVRLQLYYQLAIDYFFWLGVKNEQ
jgi:GT2 family glycosyltransferase